MAMQVEITVLKDNPLLGAAVAILLGVALVGGAGWMWMDKQATFDNVETVEGTVERSEVERFTERRDRDDDGRREEVRRWRVNVRYTYTYDGQQYTSENVYFGATGQTEYGQAANARDVVERFPEGESTDVYVDSRAPSNAFLIKKSGNLQVIGLAVAGLVVAGLGIRSLVKTVRGG